MKKQPYPILDLTGGLNVTKDPFFILDKESPSLINSRLHKGLISKDVGASIFSSDLPLDGTPMFIDTFYMQDGGQHLLIVTTKWIYKYIYNHDRFDVFNPSTLINDDLNVTLSNAGGVGVITRGAGSFITDGYAEGDLIYSNSPTNPGPFYIDSVEALTLTMTDPFVDVDPPIVEVLDIYKYIMLTGDQDNPFNGVSTLDKNGDDIYFLTNGKDKLMKWDGDPDSKFEQMDYYPKRLVVFKNRLIFGSVTDSGFDCPRRVQWSVLGDPENFSGAGSGFVEFADTPDWVVSLKLFKDRCFVIKERTLWELAYVGGTTYFIPVLKYNLGTYAPNAACVTGENFVFFSNDNFYVYDGITPIPIADNLFPMLYDTEEKIVNATMLKRCFGIYIEELGEYWVSIPTKGEQVSTLLKYNFKHKSWTIKNHVSTVLGWYSIVAHLPWVDLVGTWLAQEWVWTEKELPSGASTTLIGTPDGNIYEDDRITPTTDYMKIETKDWMFAHAERWVEFHVEAKGGPFTLCYSLDSGATWSAPLTCAYSADFQTFVLFINETSKSIRCKIESYALTLEIKWIEPWFIARKRVKEMITAI